MSQSNSDSLQNTFNISGSSITNLVGSGTIQYNESAQQQGNRNPSTNPEFQPSPNFLPNESKRTILLMAANPKSTQKLRLDEEVREIEAGLQRAKQRDRFILETRWAVRSRDMQRALLDLKPQIIHFSGHGEGKAETQQQSSFDWEEGLYLEDETGRAKLINTEALAALFSLFADRVECVILNACYSEAQAKAITQYIPYAIGMKKAIGDKAAIEFAIAFYDALGAGESIEFAYKLGCIAIQMEGIPEHLTPILKSK